MTRVALLSSEPIRARMAGIGIRYLEMARRLPALGIETVLMSPAPPEEVPELPPGASARRAERGRLAALVRDCSAAVAQGQWANDLLLEAGESLPVVIDLYDPWLVENLHYTRELGLDPYRNDHASWLLQLGRGDFFLCSGEEQRLFFLGFLAALGRINPRRVETDPDLERLIAAVPFGVPATLPAHRPLLAPREPRERRLLFGGLYDWYDPWTALEALALGPPEWRLYFIRNPNAGSTPQRLWAEVEAWCRARGWWGQRVQALDWVEADRRYDLLRDVDALVATHRPTLETRLSLRTRFLDALAAGCPVVTSEGGALSRLLREHAAGWVVPPGDPAALCQALAAALAAGPAHADAAAALARSFAWDRVLEPLVAFCRAPRRDVTKELFAHGLGTRAPADAMSFRLRRWLRAR